MKKALLLFGLMLTAFGANAQIKSLVKPSGSDINFYDFKKEFNEYWQGREIVRGSGYKVLKRWISRMEPRVYPSGDLTTVGPKRNYEEFQNYLNNNPNAKPIGNAAITATTANWTALGPLGPAGGTGAGRLQCVRFHPAGTNTIYVGAADGGLWVSTNAGASWSTTTDQIASLGVSDIAIDPSNNQIMYISTGDLDGAPSITGGDSKSTGVLKSIDGGLTWNPTGLVWTTSQLRFISKILINPLNTVEIFAFTSVGIYRTRNSGTTWVLAIGAAGNFKDGEYKPGDTTTIYGANGTSLYRSTNGGQSFSNTTFSGAGLGQIRIAVTAADPNYLYVVGDLTAGTFGRLVRSTNSGATFTTMSTSPNILGSNQGWYDLSLGASPTNKDEVMVGGIDQWRSTNGGATWAQSTFGYGGGPYVHPDQHDCVYQNGTTIYVVNDGGVARSTNNGATWVTVNGNMNIAEPYGLSLSALSPNIALAGLQDNGTISYNGVGWSLTLGGDGMMGCIDRTNNNLMFASQYNGNIKKSTNAGGTWPTFTAGLTGSGPWVVPITQDPNIANTFYTGYQQVFKSTGGAWTQVGVLPGTVDVIEIVPCPSNSNIIYISRGSSGVYKSTNAGATWVSLPSVPSGYVTDIDVDNLNANNVYITYSGYSANKVYYSNDGGVSWTNISVGLPAIPANTIVYKKNSPGAIYVGMDVGVFYKELSMPAFVPFYTGLPNVNVSDLEIYYPTGKLRAATYGRGMWETNLYSQPGVVPTAFYTTPSNTICSGNTIAFTDASSNSPTSWTWSFPGGSPASSTAQNPPAISYTANGNYIVSLVATNTVGASSPYTIAVSVITTPTSIPTNTGTCAGQLATLTVTTNASNCIWQGGQLGFTANFSPTITTVYGYTVYTGACQSTGVITMSVSAPPATPTFTQAGNVLTSSPAPGYQWYFNGGAIIGATSQTLNITATGDGFYSVWVDNGAGCQSSSTVVYLTVTKINELSVFNALEISPNPAYEFLNINFKSGITNKEISFTVINSAGQTIKSGKFRGSDGDKFHLGLEGVADGMYTLRLSNEASVINYKFIKQ